MPATLIDLFISNEDDFDDDIEEDSAIFTKVVEFLRKGRNKERVMEHLEIPISSPLSTSELLPRSSSLSSPRVSPRPVARDLHSPETSQSQVHQPERKDTHTSIISASIPSSIRADTNDIPTGHPSSSARTRSYRNSTSFTNIPPLNLGPNNFHRYSTLPVSPSGITAHSDDSGLLGMTLIISMFISRSKYA